MDQINPIYSSRFEHWRMSGENAINQLYAMENHPLFDIYCCDANIQPHLSIQLLINAVEKRLLSKSAKFIITLKNSYKSNSEWEKQKQNALNILSKYFNKVEFIHLLSNTPKETTITGTLE